MARSPGRALAAALAIYPSAPVERPHWERFHLCGVVDRRPRLGADPGCDQNRGRGGLCPAGRRATGSAHAEVMAQSPSLADKVARSTTESTLEEIASEVAGVV